MCCPIEIIALFNLLARVKKSFDFVHFIGKWEHLCPLSRVIHKFNSIAKFELLRLFCLLQIRIGSRNLGALRHLDVSGLEYIYIYARTVHPVCSPAPNETHTPSKSSSLMTVTTSSITLSKQVDGNSKQHATLNFGCLCSFSFPFPPVVFKSK